MTLSKLLTISILLIVIAFISAYLLREYQKAQDLEFMICLDKGFDDHHSTTTGLKNHKNDVIIMCKDVDSKNIKE